MMAQSKFYLNELEHWLAFRNAGLLLLFLLPCLSASSGQTFQFLPETDVYLKIDRNVRLSFQAKETREAGDPTQVEIGPTLDLFVKPLLALKKIPIFDPDEARSRLLQWSVGYRYAPSPDEPAVERLQVGFVANFPLPARVLLADRNRADLDWLTGSFQWRYRNRAKFQRSIAIRSYNPAPYASVEVFYQSQYQKWSTTALYGGCLFPMRTRFSIDAYYVHQNQTGKKPNQQLNQLGATFSVHFRSVKSRD